MPGSIISFTPDIEHFRSNTDVAWTWRDEFTALRVHYQQVGLAKYKVQTGIASTISVVS